MKGYHDSKTPESIRNLWRTPKFVFDYYDRRFKFDIDMASSDKNHLCDIYITSDEDALLHATFNEKLEQADWSKGVSVFCNPPYDDCASWVAMVTEYAERYGVKIVMLLPADTSVKWFKLAFDNCTECHLISGRLSFISEDTGKPVAGNNKGSVVFVFDPYSPVKQVVSLISREDMETYK